MVFEDNTWKRGTKRVSVYPAEASAPGNGKVKNAEFVKENFAPEREAKRAAAAAAADADGASDSEA